MVQFGKISILVQMFFPFPAPKYQKLYSVSRSIKEVDISSLNIRRNNLQIKFFGEVDLIYCWNSPALDTISFIQKFQID